MARIDKLEPYANRIRSQALFKGLSENEVNDVLRRCSSTVDIIEAGKPLNTLGDSAVSDARLGCLLQGILKHVKYDMWGNCSILGALCPGSLLGTVHIFSEVPLHMTTMLAIERCCILNMDIEGANWDDEEGRLLLITIYRNILRYQSELEERLLQKTDILSQRTIRNKLLTYVEYERAINGSESFDIPYNQQELADYLFATRSSLSLELNKLKNEGILLYKNRHLDILTPME